MKVIYCKWFPPNGFVAIMLLRWLIVREGCRISERLIRHETIHMKQQREMLYLPFFLWYGIEFLFRLCQYRNWSNAYRNISFEREAYTNDKDTNYLNLRVKFAWINYLKLKTKKI